MTHEDLICTPWRTLVSGEGFTEGPVSLGDHVAFVSINRGQVRAAALDGSGSHLIAETGGGPNGAAIDAAGRLWIAQNGGRVMDSRSAEAPASIQCIEPSGVVTTLARPEFDAPNDCAFGPDDRLYFTDPHGRLGEPRGEGPTGAVRVLDPADGSIDTLADHLSHPNGLCFTADGTGLWVNDTKRQEITLYTRSAEGTWNSTRTEKLPWGSPDGMALDSAGRLWIAATDAEGLVVRHPDGTWTLVELGPSYPTNVCFAGPELRTVIVTAPRGGRLLAAEVDDPGLPLNTPQIPALAPESRTG